MKKLIAQTVTIDALSAANKDRMFKLMETYYDAVSRAQFEIDLSKKNAVILLKDKQTQVIQGFSTLVNKALVNAKGKKSIGIFSGDTIIDKAYWGQTALGKAFLKYLWIQKIKHPFSPLYWFLISKGYKTYLMMANNFKTHYPRMEKATPLYFQEQMDLFYSQLYPTHYHSASNRILFETCEGRLKNGVADTHPELIRQFPKIAFFESKNPGWKKGDELACIAKMTLTMPLEYALKALKKGLLKKVPRANPVTSSNYKEKLI